jgi:hypothetical protein
MRINLYYVPYPCLILDGEEKPVCPVRVGIPKSSLETLVSGVRQYLSKWKIDAEFHIINTQLDKGTKYYKSIYYGPRTLHCYRAGGDFEEYNQYIRMAKIHGISNNFTNSAGIVIDFVKHIKSVKPDSIIVAGGIDVSARPEFYIDNGVDIIIQLEGEYSFAKVIEAYTYGRKLEDLISCRSYRNRIIITDRAPISLNDLLPMSLDLVDNNLKFYTDTGEGTPPPTVKPPFICLETSRGCYRFCSFCATPMRGKYRYMSPKTVEKHFAYFRKMGINNILFQEDNLLSRIQLTGNESYLHDSGRADIIEIFNLARKYGFSWEFANGLEFGKFLDSGKLDSELMEALFWSDSSGDHWRGCYRVQLSLEFLGEVKKSNLPKLRCFEEEIEILKAMLDLGVNCFRPRKQRLFLSDCLTV